MHFKVLVQLIRIEKSSWFGSQIAQKYISHPVQHRHLYGRPCSLLKLKIGIDHYDMSSENQWFLFLATFLFKIRRRFYGRGNFIYGLHILNDAKNYISFGPLNGARKCVRTQAQMRKGSLPTLNDVSRRIFTNLRLLHWVTLPD